MNEGFKWKNTKIGGPSTCEQVTRCWVRVEESRQASTFSTPARSSMYSSSLQALGWVTLHGRQEYTTLSGRLDRISYSSSEMIEKEFGIHSGVSVTSLVLLRALRMLCLLSSLEFGDLKLPVWAQEHSMVVKNTHLSDPHTWHAPSGYRCHTASSDCHSHCPHSTWSRLDSSCLTNKKKRHILKKWGSCLCRLAIECRVAPHPGHRVWNNLDRALCHGSIPAPNSSLVWCRNFYT